MPEEINANSFFNTEKELSDLSGIERHTIEKLLKGNPASTATAKNLSLALDVSLNKAFTPIEKEKGLSGRTILHHHRLISTVLTCAVHWQLLSSNPALRVKAPKVEAKEAKSLDDDDVVRMFLLLEKEPLKYQIAVYIAVLGGLRLGEIVGLKWEDINFDNGKLTINKVRQYVREIGSFEKSPKNSSSRRELKLPANAIDKLKELRKEQLEEKLKLGNVWIDSGNILVQQNGAAMFPTSPANWFRDWIRKTELPYITFHQLRHTNASILIAQGTDIATVSKRLGHSRISTTTDIYTHAINKLDEEAADNLENLFYHRNETANANT